MEARIIGLKGAGKSTLLSALSGGGTESTIATVRVGDPRVRRLSAMFTPKRTTFAEFVTRIVPWSEATARKGEMERYLAALAGAQVFLHVLRAFSNPTLGIDPQSAADLRTLDDEFLVADFLAVERALERDRKQKLPPLGKEALLAAKDAVETGTPLRTAGLSDAHSAFLRPYGLLTLVPQVLVVNTEAEEPSADIVRDLESAAGERRLLAFPFSLAREVAELADGSQQEFADELGLPGLANDLVTRAAFEQMGLMTYFTVGEDEVRAWPVRRGATAPQAAGVIHSDIERGFIRAEVVSYDAFVEKGSMKACREAGVLKLEGKDYVAQDGDIMEFRFNV